MFEFGVYVLVAIRWFSMILIAIAYLIGIVIYAMVIEPLRMLGRWLFTQIKTSTSSTS